MKVRAGANCFIPGEFRAEPGWLLYKIGENGYDFSRQAAGASSRGVIRSPFRCA